MIISGQDVLRAIGRFLLLALPISQTCSEISART
jgi:hypothetical protein